MIRKAIRKMQQQMKQLLQLKDRMMLYRITSVHPRQQLCAFSVPCQPVPEYETTMVELLEDHAFIGHKGDRFYLEEGYRLSLEEVKRDSIRSALSQTNYFLESLGKARNQYLNIKNITEVMPEAEARAISGF